MSAGGTNIIFYDIPSTLPQNAWSPNTWKTRYALNYMGLAYKTVWVEHHQVEALSKGLGAAPTGTRPNGSPLYTLPLIHDLSTGAVVADSSKIALYLDATYPNAGASGRRLIPPGSRALHLAFEAAAHPLLAPLYQYGLPATVAHLRPASTAYFERTRAEKWGVALADMAPRGAADAVEWQRVKDGFGTLDAWIQEGGVYLMGETPCYADLWIAGFVQWIKLVLPERWEDMKLWHGGRWATLLASLEPYATV
ncbi:hypothetical protein GGX14DRAFT_457589 [Mycena pura]|uniref:GST N-terminal domain-containing protein n=1 Tax=Mycena pura TaxID=153505 RepID=A0AAD6V8U6_9AGAR|nr:hypothetical protein GGX14DRAFT_457589 [Mycena pura]